MRAIHVFNGTSKIGGGGCSISNCLNSAKFIVISKLGAERLNCAMHAALFEKKYNLRVQPPLYKAGQNVVIMSVKKMLSVEKLSLEFSRILREQLSEDEIKKIIELNDNEMYDPNSSYDAACHTHDFCDANLAMEQAIENLGDLDLSFIFSLRPNSENEVLDPVFEAWKLSKKNKFKIN